MINVKTIKKVEIFTQIVNAQPFLSKCFENTKNVLRFKNKMSALQKDSPI